MLYKATAVTDLHLQGVDGSLGTIKDLYFDEYAWRIRYLVVNTGGWLSGREVLLSPEALASFVEDEKAFTTRLTRKQVEESPSALSVEPLSRPYQEQLHTYYGWRPYWREPLTTSDVGPYAYPTSGEAMSPASSEPEGFADSRQSSISEGEKLGASAIPPAGEELSLRSFKEVKGYGLSASDGKIGKLDDLLIEAVSWKITHLVVDARKWWPGGQVVIDKAMIRKFSAAEEQLVIDMSREEIKQAPPYEPEAGLGESFQRQVSDYFQALARKKYGSSSPNRSPFSPPEPPSAAGL